LLNFGVLAVVYRDKEVVGVFVRFFVRRWSGGKRLFAIQPNSTDKIERVKALLIVLGFKATQDAIQDFTF
jgi:hypothetical protein